MTSQPISLQKWVRSKVRARLLVLSIGLALWAGFLFGWIGLFAELRHDQSLLGSVRFHVATLLESQDRPELLRLIKSMAENEDVEFWVVQNGYMIASSANLEGMDRPYAQSESGIRIKGALIGTTGAVTETPIGRADGPSLNATAYLRRPIGHILWPIAAIILASFLLCFGMIRVALKMVDRATAEALHPLEELEGAIRSLKDFNEPLIQSSSGIRELETIRTAILESHGELMSARDRLAESKARDLSAEAYKRLIHDLHTPVSALRRLVKLLGSTEVDPASHEEIAGRILRLAEQVIRQVSAAKSHIALPPAQLEARDLRETLMSATEIARLANGRADSVRLKEDFPSEPVVRPHDSTLFGRAVMNLVGNAMDACRSQVVIDLKAKPDGTVAIAIADDGPGAKEEDVSLWLQGKGQSTKGDRAGLGLATANHIARLHGTRIVYRPSDLGGACFEMRI